MPGALWLLALVALLVGCASGRSGAGRDDLAVTENDRRPADSTGWILGTVRVGPLCPVVQVPPDPACRPTAKTYAEIHVIITRPSGETVGAVDLDDRGGYSVELPAGTYVLEAKPRAGGFPGPQGPPAVGDTVSGVAVLRGPLETKAGERLARAGPVTVQLTAGETVRVDLAIDTGLR